MLHPFLKWNDVNGILDFKVGTASSTPLQNARIKADTGRQYAFLVLFGDMASETIDVAITKSSDSGGTGEATMKSITQLAASASANDNKGVVINVREEEIDDTKPFLSAKVTTGGATGGPTSITMLLMNPKHGYGKDKNNATILQVVA